MVSYKLGISNRKDTRIIALDSIVKLKGLEQLDEFTSTIKNEDNLKIYLFNQELISSSELKQSLSIMYKYKDEIKKLPIIYQDMRDYLDVMNLKFLLKSLCGDIVFLEKLARHYSIGSDKYNLQGINVIGIRGYLNDVRACGYAFKSTALDFAIDDLYKKAVLKPDDKTSGEVKLNYRGMRDLAVFIYKYQKNLEEKEAQKLIEESQQTEEWVQTSFFYKGEEHGENVYYIR